MHAHNVFNYYNKLYFSLPHKGFALPFLTPCSILRKRSQADAKDPKQTRSGLAFSLPFSTREIKFLKSATVPKQPELGPSNFLNIIKNLSL